MRSIAAALTVILLLATLFCVPAYGAVPWTDSAEPGEILFRQSFSDISDYAKCGWRTGTLTADCASISVADGALAVKSLSGRAYVLMPETKRGNDATVEFTFRFTESGTENGSLSVLLTCRGEEPTNVTSVVIRANGTVDDFSDLDEAIAKAIRSGSKIKVEIPIEDGALHRMKLTAGEDSCTVERSNVQVISQGRMGFCVRNTGAAVTDVWLVNGCDYEKKIGDTASYATDANPAPNSPAAPDPGKGSGTAKPGGSESVRPKPAEPRETSPKTGDPIRERSRVYGIVAVMGGGASVLICGFSRKKKVRG